jgi:O-antigen/teichoic acid export membrane protein
MLPKFSHSISNAGLVSLFHSIKKMTVIISGGLLLFTIIIIIFGKDILSLLYGQKYLTYTLPLIILSIAVLISGFSICLDLGFVALKRPWFGVIVYGFAALISLPIGILACMRYGANGAAVGYLVGAVIVTITRWILFRNIKKKIHT